MRKRITVFVLAAMTALALMAAPAGAHPHSKAGFVGPDPTGPGGGAHNGIQCAALANPNITPLDAFECPSPVK